ncbi:MAG: glycoside hydrolase family 44 protein, partial [Oscillospiraceae bacterium]|nr:glycoside hydrolase family 44 protein [Oscillospiraceae bacterium]
MIIRKRSFKRRTAVLCAAAVMASFSITDAANVSAVFSSSYMDTDSISVEIDVSSGHKAISPYIYGINSETSLSGLKVNAIKQSDPRLSSYNWETNFSNSAEGVNSSNDNALVRSYPADRQREPALYADNLVSKAKRYGIPSRYVTLQMMGMAAADSLGTVHPSDGSARWKQVLFRKHDSFFSEPDITDNAVYMDEYVSFLVNKYGYAVDGGINGYFLDNEPENWSELYPFAAEEQITSKELIERSAELAGAVKRIDPTALVYGPSINGIEAFINLKNPNDWDKYAQDYSWFIDYYLMGMRKASEAAGTRLLDVLDVHYHTEATNGLLELIIDGTDNFSNNTRLQAPRILWDSTYTENSTIAIMHNQHIPLIPTLEASINMYYPGTKLSFSEYNFGGGGHISGGIAVADTLGIFAEYGVHMACLKPNSDDTSYQKSGINIYT